MNNVTIGIVARDEVLNNVNLQVVTKNNLKYIHNKCNYIAILNYDNSPIDTEVLNLWVIKYLVYIVIIVIAKMT